MYDVTFENVQAGLRTDYLFRAANQRGGIVLGTGDLSELALGWCTYGVGDQMAHYNVNAGVPKTLIQHLIRWVVSSSGSSTTEVGEVLTDVLDTEITPELVPAPATDEKRAVAARRPSARTRCRTSRSSTCCATASGRRRSPSWPGTRGATPAHGDWPPGFPADERRAYDLAGDPALARGVRAPLLRLQPVQALGDARTGRRSSAGGSLSPRGDWRAPSDLSARIWLDEIARIPQR